MMSTPDHWTINSILFSQTDANAVAVEFVGGGTWTVNELRTEALQAAGQLKAAGINAGDRIVVMVDNPHRFCRYWLGIALTGATMVAINTALQGNVLSHQLSLSEAQLAICDPDHESTLKQASDSINILATDTPATALDIKDIHSAKPSDLACIMFTSGTSGPSKAVEMPHAHCALFAVGTIDNYKLTKDDCFYICLPLFHANGLFMQLLACLMCGCRAVVRQKFSASNWLSDIRNYSATHTNTLGAVAAFITAQEPTPNDKDHALRVIGAAPLTESAEHCFRERFGVPQVLPLYGMTEVNIPLYGQFNESAPGTCGPAVANTASTSKSPFATRILTNYSTMK